MPLSGRDSTLVVLWFGRGFTGTCKGHSLVRIGRFVSGAIFAQKVGKLVDFEWILMKGGSERNVEPQWVPFV